MYYNIPTYYTNQLLRYNNSQKLINHSPEYSQNLRYINSQNQYNFYPINIYKKENPTYERINAEIQRQNLNRQAYEEVDEVMGMTNNRLQQLSSHRNLITPNNNRYLPPITPYNKMLLSQPQIPSSFLHRYKYAKPVFGGSVKGPTLPINNYSNHFGLKLHNEPNVIQAVSRDNIILPSIQGHNHPAFGANHFIAFALALMKQMERNQKKGNENLDSLVKKITEESEKNKKKKKKKKKTEESSDNDDTSSKNRKDIGFGKDGPKKKREMGLTRDWWKLCKEFCDLFVFFLSANKYSKYAKIRNYEIQERTKAIIKEFAILTDWILAVEEPFWNEFGVMNDLDVSFTNIDSKSRLRAQSQKITALIQKYMENLISKTSKINDIPPPVLDILYEYIRDKNYFSKKYLNTFQVNRLDFDFHGRTRELNKAQGGLLIAFLIISGVSVQQILLHLKKFFEEFKDYKHIDITGKYIGSILHYLVTHTFESDPIPNREVAILFNYYRNYHLYNEQIEKQIDVLNGNSVFMDDDEFAEYLIPENKINHFWDENVQFTNTMKNFIYSWSVKLAKSVKNRFSVGDARLKPEQKVVGPKDKKFSKKTKESEDESNDEENDEKEEEEDI